MIHMFLVISLTLNSDFMSENGRKKRGSERRQNAGTESKIIKCPLIWLILVYSCNSLAKIPVALVYLLIRNWILGYIFIFHDKAGAKLQFLFIIIVPNFVSFKCYRDVKYV